MIAYKKLRLLNYFFSEDWVKALPLITNNINRRPSRSLLNHSPEELSHIGDTEKLRQIRKFVQIKRGLPLPKVNPQLKRGAYVYKLHRKGTFHKSYDRTATQIYKITHVDKSVKPYFYYLEDLLEKKLSQPAYRYVCH